MLSSNSYNFPTNPLQNCRRLGAANFSKNSTFVNVDSHYRDDDRHQCDIDPLHQLRLPLHRLDALFVRLFRAILTDNGPEFSEPEMIEKYRPDPEHNPTKLLPRGVNVWFCDPYCSSQKPHIERFHNERTATPDPANSLTPFIDKK